MNNLFFRLVLCAAVVAFSSVDLHAEGNCPPGYYPIGGQGGAGCAPILRSQEKIASPPARSSGYWIKTWGDCG